MKHTQYNAISAHDMETMRRQFVKDKDAFNHPQLFWMYSLNGLGDWTHFPSASIPVKVGNYQVLAYRRLEMDINRYTQEVINLNKDKPNRIQPLFESAKLEAKAKVLFTRLGLTDAIKSDPRFAYDLFAEEVLNDERVVGKSPLLSAPYGTCEHAVKTLYTQLEHDLEKAVEKGFLLKQVRPEKFTWEDGVLKLDSGIVPVHPHQLLIEQYNADPERWVVFHKVNHHWRKVSKVIWEPKHKYKLVDKHRHDAMRKEYESNKGRYRLQSKVGNEWESISKPVWNILQEYRLVKVNPHEKMEAAYIKNRGRYQVQFYNIVENRWVNVFDEPCWTEEIKYRLVDLHFAKHIRKGRIFYFPSLAATKKYVQEIWTDSDWNKLLRDRGLVFQTQEEALEIAEKLLMEMNF